MTLAPTPTTAIDAETMAKAPIDVCLRGSRLIGQIEALLDLDKGGFLVPHGIGGHARELLSKAQEQIAETQNYVAHFVRLAREHPAANAALDTARREWAKRGES